MIKWICKVNNIVLVLSPFKEGQKEHHCMLIHPLIFSWAVVHFSLVHEG